MEANKFPPIGMSPAVWGPIFWATMHIVSLGYSAEPTQKEREAVTQFYNSLSHTIPCPICRTHYSAILEQMPIDSAVKSRDDLILWVYNVHNEVNKKLGKPVYTFDQFIKNMQMLSSQQSIQLPPLASPVNASSIIAGIIVGITGYYVYNKYVRK